MTQRHGSSLRQFTFTGISHHHPLVLQAKASMVAGGRSNTTGEQFKITKHRRSVKLQKGLKARTLWQMRCKSERTGNGGKSSSYCSNTVVSS